MTPVAISDMERTEQGATTMPIARNEPEAMPAPISVCACQWLARALTSATFNSVSCASVTSAERDITRCVSMPASHSTSSMRTP